MQQINDQHPPQMAQGQEQAVPSYGQNPAPTGAGAAGNQTGQFQAAVFPAGGNPRPQYGQEVSQAAFQAQGQPPQNDYGQYQQQPAPQYQTQGQPNSQFQQQYPQGSQPTGPYGPATESGPNDHGQELKHEGKMLQNGQLLDVLGGIINGNPDIQKISGLLSSTDAQFWKGAAVGAGAALVLGNPTVQSAMAGFVSNILNKNTTNNEKEKK